MWISIKDRYRLHVLLMLFLPMVVMGTLLVSFFREAIIRQYQDEQTDILISLQQNSIDRKLQVMEQILKEYETDPRLGEVFTREDTAAAVSSEWSVISRVLGWNEWIYYGDEKNRILSSPPLTEQTSLDVRRTIWYRQGKESGEIRWTRPYRSEKNSEVILSATRGIYGSRGEFTGVLGIDASLKDIFTSFKHEALQKNARILAVVDENIVINFNRKESEPIEYGPLYDWQELLHSPKGRKKIILNEIAYYAFSVRLDRLNIALVSLIPEELVEHEILPAIALSIGVILLCTLLMMFGNYHISRRIIQNIDNLNRYMSDVAAGQFRRQLCVRGRDEFLTLNEYLNNMVEALAENIGRLEETNQQKEDLIHLRTTLIHIISHNASTPITVLFNNSMDLLEEDGELEEYRQMFLAAGNLKNLMENTMVYLKLEEGLSGGQDQSIDLREITDLTNRMYRPLAENKKLQIEVDMEEGLTLEGNYFLIKTVLENMVDNALKYSHPGGTIHIRGWRKEEELFWSIRDNGPGFTPEDRQKLFQKFQRLSARPTGGEPSTGLGLYLVDRLMNTSKGRISLEPGAMGKGAAFTLVFPSPTTTMKEKEVEKGVYCQHR